MRLSVKNSLVSPDNLAETIDSLDGYTKLLNNIVKDRNYDVLEASLLLPDDREHYEEAEKASLLLANDNLKYIVVIGIGGSNLGTKAIYDAMFGYFELYEAKRYPKIIFLDTNDTKTIQKTLQLLGGFAPDEFAINIITKSGSTTETIANSEIVLSHLQTVHGKDVFRRVAVVTDKGTEFQKKAQKLGITTLNIPKNVGGRFSALSSVGLLPLMLVGIDVDSLLAGAKVMREKCLSEDLSKNSAVQSAAILYLLKKKGKGIHSHFMFHPELKSLGDWYRQLLAESIGKKEDESGNIVRTGITPETSIGSTDLHSVAQLYLGGPQDKVTTFLTVEKLGGVVAVPDERLFENIIPAVSEKTAEEIMNAIVSGTKEAYKKSELPFMEIMFDEISPFELGEFMQFRMCEIMYLGKLFNINAFNQPSVEDYKVETKRLLEE